MELSHAEFLLHNLAIMGSWDANFTSNDDPMYIFGTMVSAGIWCQFKSQLVHFSTHSLLMNLGKQPRIAQVLGNLFLCKRPERNSWLRASDRLNFSPLVAICRVKQQMEDSLYPSLCDSTFQNINAQKKFF